MIWIIIQIWNCDSLELLKLRVRNTFARCVYTRINKYEYNNEIERCTLDTNYIAAQYCYSPCNQSFNRAGRESAKWHKVVWFRKRAHLTQAKNQTSSLFDRFLSNIRNRCFDRTPEKYKSTTVTSKHF